VHRIDRNDIPEHVECACGVLLKLEE